MTHVGIRSNAMWGQESPSFVTRRRRSAGHFRLKRATAPASRGPYVHRPPRPASRVPYVPGTRLAFFSADTAGAICWVPV